MLMHVNRPIKVNERGQIPLLDFHFLLIINLLPTYSVIMSSVTKLHRIIDAPTMDVRIPW